MSVSRCRNCSRNRTDPGVDVTVVVERRKDMEVKKGKNGHNTWGRNLYGTGTGGGVRTWADGTPWA